VTVLRSMVSIIPSFVYHRLSIELLQVASFRNVAPISIILTGMGQLSSGESQSSSIDHDSGVFQNQNTRLYTFCTAEAVIDGFFVTLLPAFAVSVTAVSLDFLFPSIQVFLCGNVGENHYLPNNTTWLLLAVVSLRNPSASLRINFRLERPAE